MTMSSSILVYLGDRKSCKKSFAQAKRSISCCVDPSTKPGTRAVGSISRCIATRDTRLNSWLAFIVSQPRLRSLSSQESFARQQRARGRVVQSDDARCPTSHGLMVDIIRQFGTELSAQRLKADGTQPSELRLKEWCGIGNWQEESLVGLDRLDWLGVCPRFLGTWRAAGGSFDNGCCC